MAMYKKLTITLEEEIYEGLHRVIGRGSISRFIAELVRPHVVATDLESAYAEMSVDAEREEAADAWTDELSADFLNDPGPSDPTR